MVGPPEVGGLTEARYEEKNIIISASELLTILLPQLKNISAFYKVMCGCEYCISDKSIHSSLLALGYCHLKQLKE